jgi:pimeloyl-ACP methyl ester carboxylesterase
VIGIPRSTPRRVSWLISAALILTSIGVTLAAWLGPALSLAVALTWQRADPWLARFQDAVVVEELSIDAGEDRHVAADLYRSSAPGGSLMLVHGLSPLGRRHPEIVRIARLLARHHRVVLVPQIEGLATFRISGREVGDVRAALRALQARGGSVGVVGFSFGSGPTLLAAADEPGLSLVATFGGYADLRDIIVFLATGVHRFGGRQYVQPPEPSNRWKLLALVSCCVEDEADHRRLEQIALRRLRNPLDDTGALERELGPAGRAALALALNRRENAVDGLVAALPRTARDGLARLSPLPAIPRLSGRLLFVHGAGDASVPFTESLRLAEASGGRTDAVILESFTHIVTPPFWHSLAGRVRDGRRMLLLSEGLLTAAPDAPLTTMR